MTVKLIHTDIDCQLLATEMYQLLSEHQLHDQQQITLTSVVGNNDWVGSTGKTPQLSRPERYWAEINQAVKGTYMHQCMLRYPNFYRWRLMKIDPRSTYTVHQDGADAKRNLRLHIPVVTNPDAYLAFFQQRPETGATVSVHFEHLSAGNSYEVDTTSWHTAFNFGSEPRYHIVGVRYESLNNRPY